MTITVLNPSNNTSRQADIADDVKLNELITTLEGEHFFALPAGSNAGYQAMNKRTGEALPLHVEIKQLDIQDGDVISIFHGTTVAALEAR